MPTQRRTWLGLAFAALVAACGESTSPPLPDSQGLNSDLQTVSAVFQTEVFKSFGAIGTAPGSPAATTTPPGALLRATSPLAPSSTKQPYAATPQRLQALRAAAAGMSAAATAVIPQTLWGKTYVWDAVTTHGYVEDPNQFDGTRQGIRIILYQVDANGQVIENPLTIVGHVDLLDESDANTSKLHVIVQDASASPVTYADYTISATVVGNPVSEFTGTASGYVSDGARTVTFSASFHATQLDTPAPDLQFDVTWDLDNPPVSVALHVTVTTSDADHATLTIDLSVTRGGATVALTGTIKIGPGTVTADLTITVPGGTFARIIGTNEGITIRHPNGSELSQGELEAMQHLFELPEHLQEVLDDLFHPAEHLMGG